MVLIVLSSLASWLEKHSLPCFYKKHIGIECPGCGMQRSVIELLRGNVYESFILYPALLPTILMVVYLAMHLIFKYENGANNLKKLFVLNTVIILFNYIYKLIN